MTTANGPASARTHTRARVRGKARKPVLSSFGAVLAGLGMAAAVGAKLEQLLTKRQGHIKLELSWDEGEADCDG